MLPLPAEHLAGEGLEHPLEVGEGDVPAHGQALDLEEHELRPGRDRLVAVDAPGEDDPQRLRRRRAHGVDLPRRGVRASSSKRSCFRRYPSWRRSFSRLISWPRRGRSSGDASRSRGMRELSSPRRLI